MATYQEGAGVQGREFIQWELPGELLILYDLDQGSGVAGYQVPVTRSLLQMTDQILYFPVTGNR
jgi:hypothetical protein